MPRVYDTAKSYLFNNSATSGIGKQTAIYLSARGASVYVCALDTVQDRASINQIKEGAERLGETNEATNSVTFIPLNLGSISGTVESGHILRQRLSGDNLEGIDILVCNAGILGAPLRQLSEDGFEKTFATNCLGHFTFTNYLLGTCSEAFSSHLLQNRGFKYTDSKQILSRPPQIGLAPLGSSSCPPRDTSLHLGSIMTSYNHGLLATLKAYLIWLQLSRAIALRS
jgi:hypothetical protein